MGRDPEYTDTLEITYSGGEPCTSSFCVAKILGKHPGPGKWGSLENCVVDLAGTTVAEYMARHHAGKTILSYRPVKARPLAAEAQVTTELTPLSAEETKRLAAAVAEPPTREVVVDGVSLACTCGHTDGTHTLPCPVAEALLDRLDARFGSIRKAVAAVEAPAAQQPGPVCRECGQPNTPEHQEFEAAMAAAGRAVAALPDRG